MLNALNLLHMQKHHKQYYPIMIYRVRFCIKFVQLGLLLLLFEGYKTVEYEDSQAADEPGQMFDDEVLFGALQCRKDNYDAQPIRPITHHGQGEQQVGGALCRLSLELE